VTPSIEHKICDGPIVLEVLVDDSLGFIGSDVAVPDAVRLNNDNRSIVTSSVAQGFGCMYTIVETLQTDLLPDRVNQFCRTILCAARTATEKKVSFALRQIFDGHGYLAERSVVAGNEFAARHHSIQLNDA